MSSRDRRRTSRRRRHCRRCHCRRRRRHRRRCRCRCRRRRQNDRKTIKSISLFCHCQLGRNFIGPKRLYRTSSASVLRPPLL